MTTSTGSTPQQAHPNSSPQAPAGPDIVLTRISDNEGTYVSSKPGQPDVTGHWSISEPPTLSFRQEIKEILTHEVIETTAKSYLLAAAAIIIPFVALLFSAYFAASGHPQWASYINLSLTALAGFSAVAVTVNLAGKKAPHITFFLGLFSTASVLLLIVGKLNALPGT